MTIIDQNDDARCRITTQTLLLVGIAGLASLSWKTHLALTLVLKVKEAAFRLDGIINCRLLNFVDLKASPKSTNVVISSDVVVDSTRSLWFHLFVPVKNEPLSSSLPIILYFHAGGFATYNPSSVHYNTICRKFTSTIHAIVVFVKYRFSPKHCYPSQYDDGFASYSPSSVHYNTIRKSSVFISSL
ncbi:probable carboxylesterase 18 [Argentina anserina]|uniref:probable carboxylesterase 18 n=1 Tax=Argentina anserina TaxID=57926 RepID=UPI0021765360|nr:probable carboxylesterase 18 [Potentilla anserina]